MASEYAPHFINNNANFRCRQCLACRRSTNVLFLFSLLFQRVTCEEMSFSYARTVLYSHASSTSNLNKIVKLWLSIFVKTRGYSTSSTFMVGSALKANAIPNQMKQDFPSIRPWRLVAPAVYHNHSPLDLLFSSTPARLLSFDFCHVFPQKAVRMNNL